MLRSSFLINKFLLEDTFFYIIFFYKSHHLPKFKEIDRSIKIIFRRIMVEKFEQH
ncbi:hypothetical protein [Blattabacterium cuenoti]|uniref:hypothetical protein n=1 Tax=Blattabacterium cuenoti TaxID=1653831 RepID=UPI00374D7670